MLSVDEALERILAGVERLRATDVPLMDSLGLVLAEDADSPIDLPPFDNSAMDGYAVRAADVAAATGSEPIRLKVVGESAAGGPEAANVRTGEAVRIFTGAPVPRGADAVVMQEVTRREGNSVWVAEPSDAGRFIRPAGSNLRRGTVGLPAGTILTPPAVGLLASMGLPAARAWGRVRCAVVSTGGELAAPGEPLPPGKIHDANLPLLTALCRQAGAEATVQRHAVDAEDAIRATLNEASECDAIVCSGGVSVGDYDLVRTVLDGEGSIGFWRVAIKPGKPIAFGTYRGTPFFGLPGNPVSAFVTFEVLVKPALRKMMGYPKPTPEPVSVMLEEPFPHDPDRREYVRATLRWTDGQYHARLAGEQDSAALAALALADALVVCPEDIHSPIPAGSVLPAILLPR